MPRGRASGSSGRGMSYNGRGFTYNFGIAISSRLVNQMRLLSGQTLSLAAAFYGLSRVTAEYVDTIKHNTLYFGGQLKTIKAMKFAQDQLLKGATEFSTGDIMSGMRDLMSAGLDAQKNFKFISDAASATGQSFQQMASNVHQAISGNMGGFIQMGLVTERGARSFEKYAANTVMRQQAIMNFMKANKNLQSAINGNFKTITGQWKRVVEGVKMFAQAIVGDPNDPTSLYSSVRKLIEGIGNWMHKHSRGIRRAGSLIGTSLKFIVKQVTGFATFVGRQFGKVLDYIDKHFDEMQRKLYSVMIWLTLWKYKIADFLKEHKSLLLALFKGYLVFKGLKFIANIFDKISGGAFSAALNMRALKREIKGVKAVSTGMPTGAISGSSINKGIASSSKDHQFMLWAKKRGIAGRYNHAVANDKDLSKATAIERLYRMQTRPGNNMLKTGGKTGFKAGMQNLAFSFLPAGISGPKQFFKSMLSGAFGFVKSMGRASLSVGRSILPFLKFVGKASAVGALLAIAFSQISRKAGELKTTFINFGSGLRNLALGIKALVPKIATAVTTVAKFIGKWTGLTWVIEKGQKVMNKFFDYFLIDPLKDLSERFKDVMKDFRKWADPSGAKKEELKNKQELYLKKYLTNSDEQALANRYAFLQDQLAFSAGIIAKAAGKNNSEINTPAYKKVVDEQTKLIQTNYGFFIKYLQKYNSSENINLRKARAGMADEFTGDKFSPAVKDLLKNVWLQGEGTRPLVDFRSPSEKAADPDNKNEVDLMEMFPETRPILQKDNPFKSKFDSRDEEDNSSTSKATQKTINVTVNSYGNNNEKEIAKQVIKVLKDEERTNKIKNA